MQLYRSVLGEELAMNYSELLEILEEKKEICIFGAGILGRGEGYLFIKNMLEEGQRINYFCDNNILAGTEIVDGIQTIEVSYLYEHSNEVVCVIMAKGSSLYEIKEQLEGHNLKTYMLDEYSIFSICGEIMRGGDRKYILRVKKFMKERRYEVQIETSSFCNAQCSFCPNTTLKRKKNIMNQVIFNKIIERIKQEEIDVSTFILHLNGEPLTDSQIFMRIKELKSEFPTARIRFTSNFALATTEVIEQIIESGLDEITCSLNAIDADQYKKIMGLDYEKTVSNIECLLKRKRETGSNLKICLSIVVDIGEDEKVEKFKERWKDVDIRVMKLGAWVDKEIPQNLCVSERDGICPILYRTINFLSNGDYALCCFDPEGIVNHNVMYSTIEEAWASPVFSEVREWHLKYGRTNKECINCSF